MKTRYLIAALGVAMLGAAESPALAARLKAPGGGTIHALVVGVNEYRRLPGHSLQGARPDAQDLASVLKADGVDDLTVLLDRDATRAHFVAQMEKLVNQSKRGDLVFISYSGHGSQAPAYDNWKDTDGKKTVEEILLADFGFKGDGRSEAVVNVEVRAWLARLDAKGVDTVVLWDSCFGGGMRGVEPSGGDIRVRQQTWPSDADKLTHFPAIAMSSAEARADVNTMSHVTFLAGSTDDSVVPEMPNVDPKQPGLPRGALSYYVARALDGRLKSGGVSRVDLFGYLKTNVHEITHGRQSIELLPQAMNDAAVSDRDVFVVDNGQSTATNQPQPTPPPTVDAKGQPVRLAIVGGSADSFASIEQHATPLELVADKDQAELVWDVAAKKALEKGDTVMENVDASMIGFVADRVRTLSRLQQVAGNRPLAIELKSGGELLTPGQIAHAEATGLAGSKLIVFNIGADATVQMLYPSAPNEGAACHGPQREEWGCDLKVTPPFGVDTIVAIATADEAKSLLDWLNAHHGRHDASQLPDLVSGLLPDDSSARVGFTSVVTRAAPY